MKIATTLFALAVLLLTQCTQDDIKKENLTKGYLDLRAAVDPLVRFKGALIVADYDFTIRGKTDPTFKVEGKVALLNTPLELTKGEYSITVSSATLLLPQFEAPIYGASKDFTISAGVTTSLNLICLQTNAGVKVVYTDKFKKYCADNSLTYSTTINQGSDSLFYANGESKIGYFAAGNITSKVKIGERVFSKSYTLAAQDLLTLTVDITESNQATVTISISGSDAVNEIGETFTIDPNTPTQNQTLIMQENFDSILTGSSTSTSGSNTDWEGNGNFTNLTNIKKAGGAIKVGTASTNGSITTTPLNLSANSGDVTVKIKIKGWTTILSDVTIKVGAIEKSLSYTAVMLNEFQEISAVFQKAGNSSCSVTISSQKALFIDDIKILN